MEHVVFYPSVEGVPAFERVDSLDEAVSFVEHLRNSLSITEFSVQALTPVPLSFRAYYHVEVPNGADAAVTGAGSDLAGPLSQAPDEDRSAAWVAEAAVAEPPVAAASAVSQSAGSSPKSHAAVGVPAWDGSFSDLAQASSQAVDQFGQSASDAATDTEAEVADASVVTDVVPEAPGRRSMGFFAR